MKVSKAIENLTKFDKGQYYGSAEEFRTAVKLGFEALKRHRNRDYQTYNELHQVLPGETPEEEVNHVSV